MSDTNALTTSSGAQYLQNVRLLMQSYDSVRFAPQIHKKMALEIEQLEQQVKQSREDRRLEVDRQ